MVFSLFNLDMLLLNLVFPLGPLDTVCKYIQGFLFVALGLFLFFAPSTASVAGAAAEDDAAAAAAAYDDTANEDASDGEAVLQYLQGTGIRTRDSATADRCATNKLNSPLNREILSTNVFLYRIELL